MSMQQILPIIIDNPSYQASDFIVTCSNLEAYRAVTSNIIWPQNRLLIIGESGSGKTHLTKIWREKSEAYYIKSLTQFTFFENSCGLIFENIENYQELEILGIINFAFENNKSLLLTCGHYKSIDTPDLRSRLNATYKICIKDPDESMIEILIGKLLYDKQIRISKEVLRYISTRIKRSFPYIKIFVDHLDELSLSKKRNINVKFIKEVLEKLQLEQKEVGDYN